jgi:cob(I)alamin adenosyltransferase
MGHRLSKIYTRTGDQGTTGLGDGRRVAKTAPRIRAIGDVDELNSLLGVLVAQEPADEVARLLVAIQHDLFDLGGEMSIPGTQLLAPEATDRLEAAIDRYNETLPPLKEFILPGGSRAAAFCHLARAVCRRAERSMVEVADAEAVSEATLRFVNRLSDLLFVLARVLARRDGGAEVLWDRSRL